MFECVNCSSKEESGRLDAKCSRFGSALLLFNPDIGSVRRSEIDALPPGVWRFRMLLPEISNGQVVTLGEGGTPLLPAKRLGDELGFENLLIKDETMNPTGSFLDRGSTVLVSLARERGVKRFSCTTTGNLGASLAAYAAKAGIETEIGIHPNTDRGKLYQMIAYGAKVEIFSRASERDHSEPSSLSVSAGNPFILEGEKTTGFEIIHDLNWSQPDAIVLPVGTGGHLTMVWRSLLQLNQAALMEEPSCRLIGVQLQASAPIVADLQTRKRPRVAQERLTELEESEPTFKKVAVSSIKDSKGHGIEVSASEAIRGTSLLARTEGIFAEPAAASVVASLRRAKEEGLLRSGDRIVCVITGTGLKDTKIVTRMARMPKHLVGTEDFDVQPFEIGMTKLRMMEALSEGPAFGYGLWRALSKEKGITTASVYQHLSELERAALVRRSRVVKFRGRERIFYELTRKGSELLKALRKTMG